MMHPSMHTESGTPLWRCVIRDADATVACTTLRGFKLFKQLVSSVVLSCVAQIVLPQPDEGPDQSEMSQVVLLLCYIIMKLYQYILS